MPRPEGKEPQNRPDTPGVTRPDRPTFTPPKPVDPAPLTDDDYAAVKAQQAANQAAQAARDVLAAQADPKIPNPTVAAFNNAVATVLLDQI